MLFKPHHIEMIRNGSKVETRRNWKRCMAVKDGVYAVQTRMFQPKIDCDLIKCNYIFTQKLGDMTELEAFKEGGYTLKEYEVEFTNINGFWDDNLIVTTVGFNLHLRRF